ncbi:UDP-N-acetylmuramate dehydrogenase [Cumulibacter manganitolerans]|uniref:UDP-N-acetylmuramate dehydrogenase n=1 Tax=Cumulibacter manganitolerans TaxID=1884992 RepID=UPI0018861AC1|nr:UDP-N-acetylmuramate dehydrogenase [Cumulibacter manganitolerans]
MSSADSRPGAAERRVLLADYTTMRVGGPARMVTAGTSDELIDAVRDADRSGEPVLLIGGGSNLVIADAGFDGTVVRIASEGTETIADGADVVLDVRAGEPWDALVARTVEEGLSGIECLSGIPGLVGATPIQNVGAYGAETADVLESVEVFDREAQRVRILSAADCGFGYRSSIFKHAHRYLVLGVRLRLAADGRSAPVRYAELARTLGVQAGDRVPVADARAAVLHLRRSKGMVLDADDPDTWSAGSFFTNPIVAPQAVPEGAPAYDAPDGLVKTSAAWLIEHAGYGKGYGNERAALSSKHTLALTNRGGASADDLVALAREIRDGVYGKYAIELQPEPLLIGCAL